MEHVSNELVWEEDEEEEEEEEEEEGEREEKDKKATKKELQAQRSAHEGIEPPLSKKPKGDQSELKENEEPGFWSGILKSLMDRFPELKTRVGRAGVIYNFMRGLGLAGWY